MSDGDAAPSEPEPARLGGMVRYFLRRFAKNRTIAAFVDGAIGYALFHLTGAAMPGAR